MKFHVSDNQIQANLMIKGLSYDIVYADFPPQIVSISQAGEEIPLLSATELVEALEKIPSP